MAVFEQASIEKIKHVLGRTSFLAEPAVPELSFRPDIMANMENQLTFFEIASLARKEDVDWKTLRLIEYLFETKLFFGNRSSFHLIVLDPEGWKQYCLELFAGLFDKMTLGPNFETYDALYTLPKEENFRLWDLEREFENSRQKKIEEESLNEYVYRDISQVDLENEFFHKMSQWYRPEIERNCPVTNLKNYYITRDLNLRFYFNFLVRENIIDITSFKRINNTILQNLLIKARLIRYQKVNGKVVRAQLHGIKKMVLLVNGSIDGPEYDRLRYLRMLNAAGWDVYPFDVMRHVERQRFFL